MVAEAAVVAEAGVCVLEPRTDGGEEVPGGVEWEAQPPTGARPLEPAVDRESQPEQQRLIHNSPRRLGATWSEDSLYLLHGLCRRTDSATTRSTATGPLRLSRWTQKDTRPM